MDRSNPSKIKAVILDYGEVLCYPPSREEMGRMAAPFGMDPVPFRKLWDRDRLRYDRGDLSPEAYWSGLTKDAGTQLTPHGVGICNPAFDVTPNKYVTAIITERGVLRAPYAESLQEMSLVTA